MTQAEKERLLKDLEEAWQSASTRESSDFGGMMSVMYSKAMPLAVVSKLTKSEAQEIHEKAKQFEQDFVRLAEGGESNFHARKKRQVENYTKFGPLEPFESFWSTVRENRKLFKELKRDKIR